MLSYRFRFIDPAVEYVLSVWSGVLKAAGELMNQVERDRALRRHLKRRIASIEAALVSVRELAAASAGSTVDAVLQSAPAGSALDE